MAHNINFNKGKYSFFSVREKAWHGLGQVVQEAPTSAEAMKLAGLDFIVEKRPILINTPNGPKEVPDFFSTVRTDNDHPFGIVGSRYEVLQNSEVFEWFDTVVGNGQALFETAGALGDGATIFVTVKLPEQMDVKGDAIEQYLFLTTNHAGHGVVQAAFTPIRIVCNNTLNAALRDCNNRIRIMHTNTMKDRLNQAAKVMATGKKFMTKIQEVFVAMANKPIVDQQLKDLILATFANQNHLEILAKDGGPKTQGEQASITRLEAIVSDAYAYAMTSDTQQTVSTRGTVFGAYNTITGYLQNVKEIKEGKQADHFESIIDGSSLNISQKAFDLCVALI